MLCLWNFHPHLRVPHPNRAENLHGVPVRVSSLEFANRMRPTLGRGKRYEHHRACGRKRHGGREQGFGSSDPLHVGEQIGPGHASRSAVSDSLRVRNPTEEAGESE